MRILGAGEKSVMVVRKTVKRNAYAEKLYTWWRVGVLLSFFTCAAICRVCLGNLCPGEEFVNGYENGDGTVTLGEYTGGFTNHFVIPETIGGKLVTAVGDHFGENSQAFDPDTGLWGPRISMITVPASVRYIGHRAFGFTDGTAERYGRGEFCPESGYSILGIRFLGDAPVFGMVDWGYDSEYEVDGDMYSYPFSVRAKVFVPRQFEENWTAFLAQFGMEIAGFIGEETDGNGVTCRTKKDGVTWAYTITNQTACISRWLAFNYRSMVVPSGLDGCRIRAWYVAGGWSMPAVLPDTVEALVIPEVLDGYPVTGIGAGAFAHFRRLTDVQFPDSIREIGKVAFGGCSGLVSVAFPSNTVVVGDYAFGFCTSLVSAALSPNLESIGRGTFTSCQALESLELPRSVNNLGAFAVADCTSLSNVVLNTALLSIGDSAFAGCTALKKVVVPGSVSAIGDNAFADCGALETVEAGGVSVAIGARAFSGCRALQTMAMADGEGEGTIGMFAFEECVALRALKVPAWVKNVGICAFADCEQLTCVYYEGTRPNCSLTETENGIYSGANEYLASFVRSDKGWGTLPGMWNGRSVLAWGDYPSASVRHAVVFNLRGRGERTGGGELTQYVTNMVQMTEPTIAVPAETTFAGWEIDYLNFRGALKLAARYNDKDGNEIADYYVRADGDDANDGLTRSTAFRTINRALWSVPEMRKSDGVLILVGDGTYPSVEFPTSLGYDGMPIKVVIRSENGAAHTFVDGGGTNRCVTLVAESPEENGCRYESFVFDGFTFKDGFSNRTWWMESAINTPGGVWGGVYVNCVISNCVMHGSNEGVGLGAGAYGAVLINTLLVNNSYDLESEEYKCRGASAADCELYNCTVVGAGEFSSQLADCKAYNTIVRGAIPSEDSSMTSCFTGDPMFIDAEAGDYHLSASSPCVNTGVNDCVLGLFDLDGAKRIFGGVVDVGCYELIVEASKHLVIFPCQPSDGLSEFSKKWTNQPGIGEGRVWANGTMTQLSSFCHTYAYKPVEMMTSVDAHGYRMGDVDDGNLRPGTDYAITPWGSYPASGSYYVYNDHNGRDSFFYAWLLTTTDINEEAFETTLLALMPEVGDSSTSRQAVILPEYDADAMSYPITYLEAIFSKEFLVSDNLGDINGDRIPDIYALNPIWAGGKRLYEVAGYSAYSGGDVMFNAFFYNDDGDYLPSTAFAGEKWAAGNVPFSACWEIRGEHEGLNHRMGHDGLNLYVRGEWVSIPHFSEAETNAVAYWNGVQTWADFKAVATNEATYADEYSVWSNNFWTAVTNNASWIPENRTDPTLNDTDNDVLPDGCEYYFWYNAAVGWMDGTNWVRLTGVRFDPRTGGDGGVITSEEIMSSFDPTVKAVGNVSSRDTDHDGLTDLDEFSLGTNPVHWDSDGDSLPDGWEVTYGFNPLVPDMNLLDLPVEIGEKTVTVSAAWINQNLGLSPDWIERYPNLAKSIMSTKAANGRMSVVECYVVGLDPENETNDFRIVSFPLKADGTPDLENIAVDPPKSQWNVPGARAVVKGAATLDGEWKSVEGTTAAEKAAMRFFKVVVEP